MECAIATNLPCGGGHEVDLGIDLGKLLLQHDHREHRGAGGDVTGTGGNAVRRDHAGARIAFRRAEGDAGAELAADIEEFRPFGGEFAAFFTGDHDARQDLAQFPGKIQGRDLLVKLADHPGIEGACLQVDRECARGLADAQHFLTRQFPVHVTGQRRDEADVLDVLFAVQDCLIEVGDVPALRDRVLEEFRQCGGSLPREVVAPGTEGHQQIVVFVEGEVAVHHAADSERFRALDLYPVFRLDLVDQTLVAGLNAFPDVFDRITPDAIDERVFPVVASRRDRRIVRADHDGLDAGRSQFHPDAGLTTRDEIGRFLY